MWRPTAACLIALALLAVLAARPVMADDLLNEPAKAANAQAADQAEAGALAEAAIAASIAAATDSAVRERAGEVGAPDAVRDGDALASKRHPRLRGGSGEEPQPDDLQFWPAFVSSAGVIVATELGDKTFFIAAIMSMKHDRCEPKRGAADFAALPILTAPTQLGRIWRSDLGPHFDDCAVGRHRLRPAQHPAAHVHALCGGGPGACCGAHVCPWHLAHMRCSLCTLGCGCCGSGMSCTSLAQGACTVAGGTL